MKGIKFKTPAWAKHIVWTVGDCFKDLKGRKYYWIMTPENTRLLFYSEESMKRFFKEKIWIKCQSLSSTQEQKTSK